VVVMPALYTVGDESAMVEARYTAPSVVVPSEESIDVPGYHPSDQFITPGIILNYYLFVFLIEKICLRFIAFIASVHEGISGLLFIILHIFVFILAILPVLIPLTIFILLMKIIL